MHALLHRFAGYYFDALAAYERGDAETPAVWRTAHNATKNAQTHILQNMPLGINAHINYDLVFTLVDMLEPEWAQLPSVQRDRRYADHCRVNTIIGWTVDTVQDQVVERLAPEMDIPDKLFGPLDEWTTSHLIARWRDEVWQQAMRLLEAPAPANRERLRLETESATLQRAEAILLQGGPFKIAHLLQTDSKPHVTFVTLKDVKHPLTAQLPLR